VLVTDDFHDLLVAALPRLRAYAMMLTRSRSAADDVLQQTAYLALRSRPQFRPGTNFNAWVYRILKNEFISSIRRQKRNPGSMDHVAEIFLSRPGDQEEKIINKEIMAAAFNLPEGESEASEFTPRQQTAVALVAAAT
jgi:RNA polymerase sigma-70 factor (ECF subfamily)